jgi:hypothetical protein
MAGVTVEGLDIGLPYLGMEVEYDFAFSISRKANGSRIVQDLGISRDVVYTTAKFRLTTSIAKQLLDKWAARERDAFTVVWPMGTLPLGPAYVFGKTIDMDILDISGDVTLDSPWRMCVVTIKFMCSPETFTYYATTQIDQGNITIGLNAGYSYPQVSTDISYGVVRAAQGSNRAQMSAMRTPLDEVACATWTFDLPQANACNLQTQLLSSRAAPFVVTSAVAHTIWGVRTPQDAGFGADGYDGQARQVSKSITMVQTGALRWSLKVTVEQVDSIDYTLSYLDEADISMLTTDGSSGASTFQLTPVFSDSGSHSGDCSWSSDSSHISVSSAGLVTCLVSGSPVTATISCTLGAVTKTCSVTGYATLPDANTRYTLKGGASSAAGLIQASSPLLSLPYFYIDQKLTVDEVEVGSLACRQSATQTNTIIHGFFSGDYRVIIREQTDIEFTDKYYDYAIPAGLQRVIVGRASDGVYVAGSARSILTQPVTAGAGTHPNNFILSWGDTGDVRKIVTASGASSANYSQIQAKANCGVFYIPQNFIRYTDTMARTNYTIIPNMGTLGAPYNLTANDVPSAWFGV